MTSIGISCNDPFPVGGDILIISILVRFSDCLLQASKFISSSLEG